MDLAHVHLMLNHVPLIGTFTAACVIAWALLRKSDTFKRFGMVVLVISALVTLPTYFTGEPAEERVEHFPGVERAVIHEHEEAGEAGIIVMSIAGTIALAALILTNKRPTTLHRWSIVILLISLFSFSVMSRVAYLGGQVMHPELRGVASPAAPGDHDE